MKVVENFVVWLIQDIPEEQTLIHSLFRQEEIFSNVLAQVAI